MIEIKHLKTLQALRNSGSLAGAAAALHQTQSALSHQFSDLEQRLGFRLFVRKSQPLRFTPQGEILLQLANQVLPQIARALQDCNEPQQTRLRLAIECHSCIQWLRRRWRISAPAGHMWRSTSIPASPSTTACAAAG